MSTGGWVGAHEVLRAVTEDATEEASAQRQRVYRKEDRRVASLGRTAQIARLLSPPSFEVFTRGTRQLREPAVHLYANTHIFALNRAAYESLGRPERVECMFDPRQRMVGFRATAPDNTDGYKVRPTPKGATFLVHAKAFVKHLGIEGSRHARHYPVRLFGDVLAFAVGPEAVSSSV